MKLLPANVRSVMESRRLIQADVARALKWSEAKVSRLFNEKVGDVTLTQITDLAALLGVSPALLVDLEDVAQNDVEREILRNSRLAEVRDVEIARQQLKPRSVT